MRSNRHRALGHMKLISKPFRTILIGWAYGFIIGVLFEELHRVWEYVDLQVANAELARRSGAVMCGFNPPRHIGVWILCAYFFAVSAPVAIHLLLPRSRLIALIWIALGAIGLTCAYLFGAELPDRYSFISLSLVALLTLGSYELIRRNPRSLTSEWLAVAITGVIALSALSQIVNLTGRDPSEVQTTVGWLVCLIIASLLSLALVGVLKLFRLSETRASSMMP